MSVELWLLLCYCYNSMYVHCKCYILFFFWRGTTSLEECFVFAGEGMRRNSKIVDYVNMCIILLKHVQQTVR